MHGDADGVIEALVAVQVGIAEGVAAQDQRGQQQDRELARRGGVAI